MNDVAARIAQQTLAARAPDYSVEVRRLLDAGRAVMARNGTASRARVADIVAEAGLSNEAFYRHFASKGALVAAILEDGTERLKSYLTHQMSKESTPAGQVRRWVEGVLSQAVDVEVAAPTLAVLWNAGGVADQDGRSSSALLSTLLWEPFARLGSDAPELDASLVASGIVGRLSELLWQSARPTLDEVDHLVRFALRTVGGHDPAV